MNWRDFICIFLMATQFIGFSAHGQGEKPVPYVNTSIFEEGRSWVWLYSQFEGGSWRPYYFEKYKLVDRVENYATFEMVSWPASGSEGLSHHRFKVNLRNCGPRGKIPANRGLKIEFWTRNPRESLEWTMVSRRHSSLPFLEKFNCINRIGLESIETKKVTIPFGEVSTVAFKQKIHVSGNSFYIESDNDLRGVAAEKLFQPHKKYRFQLVEPSI